MPPCSAGVLHFYLTALQVEGARLALKHAKMLEADGKPEEAANLLQEVQVETCPTAQIRQIPERCVKFRYNKLLR